MTSRFRFLGPGIDVTGPVQGNGGFVASLARLEQQQRLLADGHELGVYEPEPGCVCVFPEFTAQGNGQRAIVPLAQVTISQVSP